MIGGNKSGRIRIAETQTIMTFLEKVVFSFKEIIFASLLAFGRIKACVIFGVISLVFAFLFALITKNSDMAKSQKLNIFGNYNLSKKDMLI